jgi:hypothetical protein
VTGILLLSKQVYSKKMKIYFQTLHFSKEQGPGFVEQKLMLSSTFKCEQIHNNDHISLCYSGPTWIFHRGGLSALGQGLVCWTKAHA